MQYKDLKEKAKKAGLRVTKDVRGKRVKLTAKELRAKIRLNFENSVKNSLRLKCDNPITQDLVMWLMRFGSGEKVTVANYTVFNIVEFNNKANSFTCTMLY